MRIDVPDHPDAEHSARPAATLIALRDADELEVLMVERGAETAFGGMWAFPGGVVEDADVPSGSEPDPFPAARRAAVRETLEETGVSVDESSLVWWSHWLPPGRNALSPKRFSTWFFVAATVDVPEMVNVETRPSDEEIATVRWVAPAVALNRQERGEILLAPPTYVTLVQLARYGDADSVVRGATPRHFATEVAFEGETRLCLWEGDAAYGGGDHADDGRRHRLAMDEINGWRYTNTVG